MKEEEKKRKKKKIVLFFELIISLLYSFNFNYLFFFNSVYNEKIY
jgi:hypothetical protein